MRQGIGIAPGADGDTAIALHHQRGGGNPVDEIAVMADQQHGAVKIIEQFLQQVERFDIEIIGRLIENEQVCRLRHQTGEQQARLLPARKRGDRAAHLLFGEQKILQIAHNMPGRTAHHNLVIPARAANRRVFG